MNRHIITGTMILNHFLAYLFRLQGMLLPAVLSIILYFTKVLFSTVICYFSKPYPGFLEVSDLMQSCTQILLLSLQQISVLLILYALSSLSRERKSQEVVWARKIIVE